MSTVAERFWEEVLDLRRAVAEPERPRATRRPRVLVRTHRGVRTRPR